MFTRMWQIIACIRIATSHEVKVEFYRRQDDIVFFLQS